MNANQIIRRPLVTEKSTLMREAGANVIAFEVDPGANKIQVKDAVEELFKVKVDEVRLFNVRGKVKKMGRYSGKRRDWRKAYVSSPSRLRRAVSPSPRLGARPTARSARTRMTSAWPPSSWPRRRSMAWRCCSTWAAPS